MTKATGGPNSIAVTTSMSVTNRRFAFVNGSLLRRDEHRGLGMTSFAKNAMRMRILTFSSFIFYV